MMHGATNTKISIEIFDADVELCNLMRARTGATG